MKIGILQCDHVSEEFRADVDDYGEMFTELLAKADAKLEFECYPVIDGVFPNDINECEGWLITGSRFGSYEDLSWIQQLSDFIKQLDKQKRKTVGICFGHQLIAQVLGGESGKSDKGWGIGVQTWHIEDKPIWMKNNDREFSLLASHQDQVKKLPGNAMLIASSEFCEFASFQIDEHILTFQGHPEFPKQYSHDLMMSRTDRIPTDQLTKGLASLEKSLDDEVVAQWMVDFLKGEVG